MLSGERTKKGDDGMLLILVNINDAKLYLTSTKDCQTPETLSHCVNGLSQVCYYELYFPAGLFSTKYRLLTMFESITECRNQI